MREFRKITRIPVFKITKSKTSNKNQFKKPRYKERKSEMMWS